MLRPISAPTHYEYLDPAIGPDLNPIFPANGLLQEEVRFWQITSLEASYNHDTVRYALAEVLRPAVEFTLTNTENVLYSPYATMENLCYWHRQATSAMAVARLMRPLIHHPDLGMSVVKADFILYLNTDLDPPSQVLVRNSVLRKVEPLTPKLDRDDWYREDDVFVRVRHPAIFPRVVAEHLAPSFPNATFTDKDFTSLIPYLPTSFWTP